MSKWIPCDVKQPEHDGKYIVSKIDGTVGVRMYADGKWISARDVTAWMEFPKPYKAT